MVRRDLLIGLLLLVGAAGACDKADIVRTTERLADRTCACVTRACLAQVEREHSEERVADLKGLPPDDVQALEAANRRRLTCRERILTAHATDTATPATGH